MSETIEVKRGFYENTNKTLDRSPVGDSVRSALAVGTLPERFSFNKGHNIGFVAGRRIGRDKRRGQKRELRRLNLVIQQMSWKLHAKRRREWIEAFLPYPWSPAGLVGATVVALLVVIVVLVFK